MSTRKLASLGFAIVLAVLGVAAVTPKHQQPAGYVPAQITVAQPAAAAREATPVTYTLPTLTPTTPPCGETPTVDYPDSTEEVTFDGLVTTNGYIKVVAVLSDTGRTFTTPLPAGWQVAPVAPYRAEYLTPATVTPCPPAPAPEAPPAPEPPATQEEAPHANDCRD